MMTGDGIARMCRCLNDCMDGRENSTCILQENAKCYRKLEYDPETNEVLESAGCLASTKKYLDQCNIQAKPEFRIPTDYKCCDDSDFCNDRLNMKLPQSEQPESIMDGATLMALIISISVAFFICVVFVGAFCIRFKRREKERKKQIDEEKNVSLVLPGQKRPQKLNELLAEYSTGYCSSGSGVPLLVQRTIARQIELVSELGRGRYGKVMLGEWREEKVAVKIFNTTDEDSWFRETEIYQTVLLRHENILCFIASDINGTGSWTQLYLITDYHVNGSLYDYLNYHTLTLSEAMTLAHTASCGLAHLHIDIVGTQGKSAPHTVQDVNGKPAIAHRDVKSKNILVKKDKTCCIADMGLAVKFNSALGKVEKGNYETSCRQGTKRYMSPEMLNGTFMEESFDAYKASDVYSFSLVLWEILNCIELKGEPAFGYHLPYYDSVGNDPDFDEMRKVIDIEGIRPEPPSYYNQSSILVRFFETMQECWSKRPESRLSMLRVRKTLHSIVTEINGGDSDRDYKTVDPYTNQYIYSNNSSVNKELYNSAMDAKNANNYALPSYPPVHSGVDGQIFLHNGRKVIYHSDESANDPLINDDSANNSANSGSLG